MIESQPTPRTYPDLLATLKTRIRDARLRAAVSVNRELILLYWEIGRDILLDLGRILSARLRAHGEQAPGWTG